MRTVWSVQNDFILHLIGWEGNTIFLDQSQNVIKK